MKTMVFLLAILVAGAAFARNRPQCPCVAISGFSSFVDDERELVLCTNDTPKENFVRLVATNLELVVLFEFPPNLYCGWQPPNGDTVFMPIGMQDFDRCERLMMRAAARQHLGCSSESQGN